MSTCWSSEQLSLFNKDKKRFANKKIKFDIPKPSYNITVDKLEESTGKCYARAEFHHKTYRNITFPWIQVECYQTKRYKTNNRLIILHIRNKAIKSHNKNTIIFSHGNYDDLGTIYPLLIDLASQLKVLPPKLGQHYIIRLFRIWS
jgi:hypothetical protein